MPWCNDRMARKVGHFYEYGPSHFYEYGDMCCSLFDDLINFTFLNDNNNNHLN